MQPVYMTATAQGLPSAPVSNDAMVDYMGRISGAEWLGRLPLHGLSTEVLHGFLSERKARQQAGAAA